MDLQKKIMELKGSIYVNKTEVLEELGKVAQKILEIFDNSYAMSPEVNEALHELRDKVLGLLVEPSKEKRK